MTEAFTLSKLIETNQYPGLSEWIECNQYISSLTDIK